LEEVLDLFTSYRGDVYSIYAVGRGGRAWELSSYPAYKPYFYLLVPPSKKEDALGLARWLRVDLEEVDMQAVEAVDVGANIEYRYSDSLVYKVYCETPRDVPRVAGVFTSKGFWGSAYNIPFDARCSLDLAPGFIGAPGPMAFYPPEEAEAMADDLVKRIYSYRVAAFDIEVASEGGFPRPGAPVLTVSYVVFDLGENPTSRELYDRVVVLENRKWDNYTLAADFIDALAREKVDIIAGYNSLHFDLRFLLHGTGVKPSRVLDSRPLFFGDGPVLPHVDLLQALDVLRPALKVRSRGSYQLDDVAVEAGLVDPSDPFDAEMLRLEESVDRSRIAELYEADRDRFTKYAKYDVVLTALLAWKWIPVLLSQSASSKLPATMLAGMNTGQVVEILMLHWLEKLGFAPELRKRRFEVGKVARGRGLPELYSLGKVFSAPPGVYESVLELDFDQLYPTIYTTYMVDPLSVRLYPSEGERLGPAARFMARHTRFYAVLGVSETASSEYIAPRAARHVYCVYSPLTPLLYNLYALRARTKAMKKRDPRFDVLDQAVKIFVNSVYGAFGKQRSNLLNEYATSYIFFKSSEILLRTIRYVESKGYRVVYGDTDSLFIAGVPRERAAGLEEEVNRYVKQEFGPLFSVKAEGWFDRMVIARRKGHDEPLRKSYILIEGGEVAEVKGVFFKIDAPMVVKEDRAGFYREVLSRGARSRQEVVEVLWGLYSRAGQSKPYSCLYYKAARAELESEETGELKNLNKVEHFVMLFKAYLMGLGEVVARQAQGGFDVVVARFSPEAVEEAVFIDAYYLPIETRGKRKSFVLYARPLPGGGHAVYRVFVEGYEKVEDGYRVRFRYSYEEVGEDGLRELCGQAFERFASELLEYLSPQRSQTLEGYTGGAGGA